VSSRDDILAAARSARPAGPPLPDVTAALGTRPRVDEDLAVRFADAARGAGARVLEGARADVAQLVRDAYPDARRIVTAGETPMPDDPHDLADTELFVCEAVLGVAESGAVWLPASRLGERAALFLAQYVVVPLDRAAIVATLHDAYARLDVAAEPFGAFVCGPSKTADIEQSLVVGAHGPKGLTLLLLGD
jgi:L-lactate dehydrogenase complex protein LldG